MTLCGFLEVFPQFDLKTGHYRKTYKMYLKPIGFPVFLQDTTESKTMVVGSDGSLREGGVWVKWREKMPRIT